MQTAGGVDDQHVAASVDGLAAGFLGEAFDGGRVGFFDVTFDAKMPLDKLFPEKKKKKEDKKAGDD